VEGEQIAKVLAHRDTLSSVTFIGITGSCGKTTTKDLATGLLAPTLTGVGNPGSGNCGRELAENVFRVRPCHDFCIQELGAWGAGTLDAGLELVKPDIGVILNVRRDHYAAFRGLEYTAAEKAKVIECLPRSGTGILNADDPLVWQMRGRTRGRILSFGSNPDADFRIKNVRSAWPDRLSFELSFRDEFRQIQTQLIGEHLVGSAVAAIAIARTMGVTLDEAVERIAQLPPTERRMSSVVTDSGVTFVRDDFKATSDSLGEFLHFMECARADRKIAVIGRISDYPGRSRGVYTSFARSAANVADLLIFVGERPESLWGGARRTSDEFLSELTGGRAIAHLFENVRGASSFLRGELRHGDLVVLKGSGASDHLERILLDHQTTVECWRAHCGLIIGCDSCNLLSLSAEPGDRLPEMP
jgi:UDP-N-acetylmuramoyl-tripeptide--D-alanyl-D-alanine ligase